MPGFRGSSWSSTLPPAVEPARPTGFETVTRALTTRVGDVSEQAAAAQQQAGLALTTAAVARRLAADVPAEVERQVKAIDIEPIAHRAADIVRSRPLPTPGAQAFQALARLAQLRDAFLDTEAPDVVKANKRLKQERDAELTAAVARQLAEKDTALAEAFLNQFRELQSPKYAPERLQLECLQRVHELLQHEIVLIERLR